MAKYTCDGAGTCEKPFYHGPLPGQTAMVCRGTNGNVCDVSDYCDGTSVDCTGVFDAKVAKGAPNFFLVCMLSCRARLIQLAQRCSHMGTPRISIPPMPPAGVRCGTEEGDEPVCNKFDTCDGNGNCLPNLAPENTFCRYPVGDAEGCVRGWTCNANGVCNKPVLRLAGYPCRPTPTGSDAACDPPEVCTGVAGEIACPAGARLLLRVQALTPRLRPKTAC